MTISLKRIENYPQMFVLKHVKPIAYFVIIHDILNFKKIHVSEPIYSARVSLGYRTLGVIDDDTIIWFWIGSHADYDKLIDAL